jgi:nicotinic acid phosphoribosyltransferase
VRALSRSATSKMNAVSPLLTDLYQLAMLQAYFARGMSGTAVFELFVRRLPANRNFLVAAGLEQALESLEALRFGEEEINWVRESGMFQEDFGERLHELRFTGDVHAMPEGTVFFADEPVLRVVAPLPEAQLIESRLVTSADAPSLDAAYKLQEYARTPRRKRSPGKSTLPGRKQVYRFYDAAGRMDHDVLATDEDGRRNGEALLQPVMVGGKRLAAAPTLADARARVKRELAALPEGLRELTSTPRTYRVEVAPALRELAAGFDARRAGE